MGVCQLSTQDENYVHCIRRISNRAEDGWDGKKKNERSFLTRKTTQHTQQTHELAIIFGLRKDEQTKYRALFFQCSATEQQQSEKH